MKILIVQASADEQAFRSDDLVAQEYPQAERRRVNGRAALLQALERETFDLAVLDGSSGWKQGCELLQVVHELRPWLPVVLIPPADPAAPAGSADELRQGQTSREALLSASPDAILIIDNQRRVSLASQTFCERMDKRPEEVIGRTVFDLLPPALAEKRDAVLRQVFETNLPAHFEGQGVAGWLDSTVIPVLDLQGKATHVVVYIHDITELKQLEFEQMISKQIIDTLLNAPMDVILLIDRQGQILRVNQPYCQRYGKSVEEVLGRTLDDLLPPALAQKRGAVVKQVFESGEIVRFEDQGVFGWFDNTAHPVFDDQGQVAYVAVFARDISERKRMEEDLRRDQRIFMAMANAPGNVFCVLDRSGLIVMANEMLARGLERPLDELIGLCFWDLLPEPVTEVRRGIFNQVLATGFPKRVEDHDRFGSYDVWVVPIVDDQGEIIQVAVIARDINDRKRSEQALKASEQRYRRLVETSPDGIALHDLDSRLMFANQQFATLFGYESPEAMYNLHFDSPDLIAEGDRRRLAELAAAIKNNGAIRDFTIQAQRKDGSQFVLEINGAMINDPEGKPVYFLNIYRDITERSRLAAELVKAGETLGQRVIERTAELQAANRLLRKEVILRKQAEEQWQRQALHAQALVKVASRASATLDLKTVLDAICAELIRVLPYQISAVSLYREQTDSFVIEAHASQQEIPIERIPPVSREMFEEYLLSNGPLIVIPDVASLPAAEEYMFVAVPDLRTLISIPLYDEGQLIGILSVVSVAQIIMPGEDELDLLQAIADHAVLSIKYTRLFGRVSEGQASLKALNERLVEVQEEERRYLARELHDEIGQNLTSLSLNLEIINRSLAAGEKLSTIQVEMEGLRELVKRLLNQVRDLSLNLLPAMLDDLGLLPTLLDHCQRFTAQTGIRVELVQHGLERRLPVELETAAYRIIQEALTNVARYAGVDQVDVRLWATPFQLGVQVEDQGSGFDLQLTDSSHRSNGLSGMRERAASCNGTLEIETAPGLGTCLTAEFPLGHSNPLRGAS